MVEYVNKCVSYNMEDLRSIINSQDSEIQIYFIKKTRKDYICNVFPNEMNVNIKNMYKENFNNFITDKEDNTGYKKLVKYDEIHAEKGSIQYTSIDDNDVWFKIKQAINCANKNNNLMNKYNFSDDYSMTVICFKDIDNREVYLISKYNKIKNWYKKSMKFCLLGGSFKEFEEDIVVLNGCIDCVIMNDEVYIFLENNFDRLFNFTKRMIKIIEDNKDHIEKCSFVDNPKELYRLILENKRSSRYMVRVLNEEEFTFKRYDPTKLRNDLVKNNDDRFKLLKYDEQDRIIVNAKSRDIIIDIIRKVYVLDFSGNITKTKGA